MPLVLAGASVAFGAVHVLDDIHLSVATGEVVAIMGPSGSGKTTLLSVLAGLRAPARGTRTLEPGDQMPNDVADVSVAWVFQTSPVLMRRTALANASLGARCAGLSRRESDDRARHALADLGIGHLAHQRLHRMSGGERQRVVIARAMSSGADLVIADEPTAALDGSAKARVSDALTTLAENGAAVVVATHDPAVASRAARVLLLDGGRLSPTTKPSGVAPPIDR